MLDILFKDMNDDYKLIEEYDEQDDSDSFEDQSEEEVTEIERENIDIDSYMNIKGVLTIERIKDIVGEIMNSCQKKMKYEILETIMRGVIFQKKRLRESFM